jgi:hypothetical protein
MRFFSTQARLLMRKTGEARTASLPEIAEISGDIDKDGIHRFELDLLESAEWTKNLLESMATDHGKLKKLHKPFVAPTKDSPLCFKTTRFFTYDFTKRPSQVHPVSLLVKVSELGLKEDQHRKLLLIAGDYYDPAADVITLESSAEGNSIQDNKATLLDVFKNLLSEAKVSLLLLQCCFLNPLEG